MNPLQLIILFLGRMCLSTIFILSALNILVDWQGNQTLVTNALSDMHQSPQISSVLDFASSHLTLVLVLGTMFQLVGGVFVFLGIRVRFGALLLILFLIPYTILFYPFWLTPHDHVQKVMFLKNMSILGGLLILLAFGKGKVIKPKPVKE